MKWNEYRSWAHDRRARAEYEHQMLVVAYFVAIAKDESEDVLAALRSRIARGWSVPS